MDVRVRCYRTPQGWEAIVQIPLAPPNAPLIAGGIEEYLRPEVRDRIRNARRTGQPLEGAEWKATGRTPAEALGMAAQLAQLVEGDAALLSILPPGAAAALAAIREIADAGAAGDIAAAIRKYTGPALGRLARSLGKAIGDLL